MCYWRMNNRWLISKIECKLCNSFCDYDEIKWMKTFDSDCVSLDYLFESLLAFYKYKNTVFALEFIFILYCIVSWWSIFIKKPLLYRLVCTWIMTHTQLKLLRLFEFQILIFKLDTGWVIIRVRRYHNSVLTD